MLEKYPYFSHAHFLLLKQSLSSQSDYDGIAEKTALHFANPLLLQHQLRFSDRQKPVLPPMPLTNLTETIESTVVPQEQENVDTNDLQSKEDENTGQTNTTETPAPVITTNINAGPVPPLLFEPLHTTDYFASQGIKLSETTQAADRMGRQLKSFTEWLKTMKKVHPATLDKKASESPVDLAVQNMAEKSNMEEEVITESMAEVYLQQGKTQKAKEIYQKLSLLNPAKNAYFAAKLNEIQ